MNRLLLLLPVTLLVGCTTQDGLAPGVSGIQTLAIVRLATVQRHLAVPVALNGRTVEVVLDTGANDTTLTEAGANNASLNFMRDAVLASGLGGTTAGRVVVARDLSFAGARIANAALPMLPGLAFGDPRLAGVVGSDVLANWDLDLDVTRALLRLDRPQRAPVVPPWTHATTAVPILDAEWPRIVVSVVLDGHKMNAMLDTGAPYSVVDGGTPAAGEVAATDRRFDVFGIARIPTAARIHRFDDLAIGGLHLGPIVAAVADRARAVPGGGMILGLDVLRLTRFYVAAQAHQLLIDEGAP